MARNFGQDLSGTEFEYVSHEDAIHRMDARTNERKLMKVLGDLIIREEMKKKYPDITVGKTSEYSYTGRTTQGVMYNFELEGMVKLVTVEFDYEITPNGLITWNPNSPRVDM